MRQKPVQRGDEDVDLLRGTPDAGTDEFDGGKIVLRALVVASCDTSEVLDAVEESLNEVALPIEPAREGKALLAVGARRDVGPGILAGSGFSDGVAVVALIGKQRGALGHRIKQGFGFLAVVDLTASQAQGDGTTASINEGTDLAREAASGTSHAAIIGSPFLPVAPCWWTRTQLESIITISP